MFPPEAGIGVHDATGVGPVVIGAGHVVVVHWLPAVGPDAEHQRTGMSLVLFGWQSVSIQPLLELADCGVHDCTPTHGDITEVQVVVVQLFPAFGPEGTQVPGCTAVWVLEVEQTVCWWPFRSVAGLGVQVCTTVGPLSTSGAGQVVAVQLLPELAAEAAHELTATLLVLLFEQVTVVHSGELALAFVQEGTGTLVVVTAAGQVVLVQLFPEEAPEAVQVATGTFVVVTIGQTVAV